MELQRFFGNALLGTLRSGQLMACCLKLAVQVDLRAQLPSQTRGFYLLISDWRQLKPCMDIFAEVGRKSLLQFHCGLRMWMVLDVLG